MRLEQSILIRRSPRQVWEFLGSVENISRWDRGVERTATAAAANASPVGLEFDTFAETGQSEKGKMSYRIAQTGENSCTVELTSTTGNARFFKRAAWVFSTRPDPEGTILVCSVDFVTRPLFFFMAPVLYMLRSEIAVDLECLKHAIESVDTQSERTSASVVR